MHCWNVPHRYHPTLGNYPAKQLELIDFMPVFLKAKRRVSAKHSANLMTRFKQVLSYAVRHGLLKYNVLTELKKPMLGCPLHRREAAKTNKVSKHFGKRLMIFPFTRAIKTFCAWCWFLPTAVTNCGWLKKQTLILRNECGQSRRE